MDAFIAGAVLTGQCEPDAFDEAREYQIKRIDALKKQIANAEIRVKEIDNVDKNLFKDMREYDKFIEAEEKRKALERKILDAVDEQIKKLDVIWTANSDWNIEFENVVYARRDLDRLVISMKAVAMRDHSVVRIAKFVDNLTNARV